MAKKQIVDLSIIDRSTPEGRKAWSKAFIDNGMIYNWREARIVNRIFKAAKAAGNPVVSVWDGADTVKVKTMRDMQEEVFNLDECRLYLESGSWVFIVMGNGWDALSDYTTDIEELIAPVNAYIEKREAAEF